MAIGGRNKRLPVILQTEATECGLACIAMIANYHGHKIDLNILRKRHLVSLKGATLKSIMGVAGDLGLSTRPLRLDLDHMSELQLPAVLHWDMNHFVVLKKISRGKAHIIDPGIGLQVMPISRLSRHFTGVALEISRPAEFNPVDARLTPHIKLLWSRLSGLKRALFQTLILSIALQIMVLVMPFYLQIIVDGVLPRGDYHLLTTAALGFAALAVLRAATEATRSWAILIFGNQMSQQMIGNVFRHLIRLPVSYFEKRHIGDLISRMGSTTPIQEALTQSVVAVLIDGLMALLMLAVMFIYSPLLGSVVLLSVILLMIATVLIYPHMRRTQEEAIYAKALENSHVIESIRASTSVKLFGRETQREAAWRNLYTDFINANVDYGKYVIGQKFAETLLTGLQIVLVVYLAANMMIPQNGTSEGFSLGMLVAFLAYRQHFTDSMVQVMQKGIEFRLLSLHLDRLSDIIFTHPEPIENKGQTRAWDFKGHITIENLWFRYSDNDPWVLENVSMDITAGSMSCLTGLSGGGKTTLLKLILGLYRPSKGRILIDGQNLADIPLAQWRQHIGVVMQDDRLLSGTIADNISFFDPEMDMQKVYRAAQAAHIHEEIKTIPMNYLSMVGDMGSILSGGQKQRVLLARALYHSPSVLFLDEGTANLDSETEKEIVSVIAQLDITRVIVAHRPAFIKAANQLFTL